METAHTHCTTRLLDDAPSNIDAFGAHQRIANALSDLIQHEEGGKTIALTGSWGSGKSTVVRLLSSALSETSANEGTAKVFVFDAWAHQGDPLRRTFLEHLIDFFVRAGVGK